MSSNQVQSLAVGLPDLVKLDAPPRAGSLAFIVTAADISRATPGRPTTCAIAMAGRRQLRQRVYITRDLGYVVYPATKAILRHNPEAVRRYKLREGDLVLWRYALARESRKLVAAFDRGAGFPECMVRLDPPTQGNRIRREKANKSRRRRADNAKAGKPVLYKRRVLDLTRAAEMETLMRAQP